MPKRPTLRAREAEKKLLRMLEDSSKEAGVALPPVRKLGEQLGLSFATVSRLLQRFVQEGRLWQHPNGRFFPAHAGSKEANGLPIVVMGRQIQNWSRLYQEIFEGVSEICAARGCPLVFLSSDKLVRHDSPEVPPVFASRATQREELRRLADARPRLCGGLLLDHLWDEKLIEEGLFSSIPRLMLARQPLGVDLLSVAPDFASGARLILEHLARCKCKRIYITVPFRGDQMIDAAEAILRQTASDGNDLVSRIESLDCSTPEKRNAATARLVRVKSHTGVICTEDNVASLLWKSFDAAGIQQAGNIELVSMQGTGVLAPDAPITRLRYDYRQLGRDAVTMVLERRKPGLCIPRLYEPAWKPGLLPVKR